jgi:hypothetical protein
MLRRPVISKEHPSVVVVGVDVTVDDRRDDRARAER